MLYYIKARDRDGSLMSQAVNTAVVPSIGDCFQFPSGRCMKVEERVIGPYMADAIEVWLGGTLGWPNGSVRKLFDELG